MGTISPTLSLRRARSTPSSAEVVRVRCSCEGNRRWPCLCWGLMWLPSRHCGHGGSLASGARASSSRVAQGGGDPPGGVRHPPDAVPPGASPRAPRTPLGSKDNLRNPPREIVTLRRVRRFRPSSDLSPRKSPPPCPPQSPLAPAAAPPADHRHPPPMTGTPRGLARGLEKIPEGESPGKPTSSARRPPWCSRRPAAQRPLQCPARRRR
jgi:hypothetical protein